MRHPRSRPNRTNEHTVTGAHGAVVSLRHERTVLVRCQPLALRNTKHVTDAVAVPKSELQELPPVAASSLTFAFNLLIMSRSWRFSSSKSARARSKIRIRWSCTLHVVVSICSQCTTKSAHKLRGQETAWGVAKKTLEGESQPLEGRQSTSRGVAINHWSKVQ